MQIWRFFFSKVKSIEIAITYACNFKCPGCYAEDLKTTKPTMLSKEMVLGFIKKYNAARLNKIESKDEYRVSHTKVW